MIMKNQKGIAYIMALAIMFMLLSLGMAYVIIARSQTVVVSNQRDALKALYIAEAGAEDALDQLFIDSTWDTGFSGVSFAGGEYTVGLLEDKYGIIEIESVGTFGGASKTLRTEVLIINPAGITELLGTVAAGGGKATFTGSSGTITGIVVIKGKFTQGSMNTDDARIIDRFGNLPEITVDFGNYESDFESGLEEIDPGGPGRGRGRGRGSRGTHTFVSGGTYDGAHVLGNVVIEDNVTINGTVVADGTVTIAADVTINGSVVAEDGNTEISSRVTINGTVMAEDNVVIENAASVTIAAEGGVPVDGYPAIIAQGEINMDGVTNSNITGLIYAQNDVNMDNVNNVTLSGGIITGKNLNASNGAGLTVNYNEDMDIQPPHFTYPINDGTQEGIIAVISWKAYPGS